MDRKYQLGICINKIKKACLEDIYNRVQGKGRTWGKKSDNGNPYNGSHITLIEGDEIVVLIQPRGTGELILKQFKLVDKTILGGKITQILEENSFKFSY